jgi:hypothetical protein
VHAPGRNAAGPGPDAIVPAPSIVISQIPLAASPAPPLTLEHYRIDEQISLPVPDTQGIRTFKGRRYVDVPDGGVVHVGADPQTGLYRAKLPGERTPSGPTLLRDTEDLLWHPLEAFEPITFPLSGTRLQAFASDLDFTDVQPDQDHLHRYDNKLYVVIENHAYQVLHDLDASSPVKAVMRIVHADYSRADTGNVYLASRPERSEPVVFDVLDGWVGTVVGGAGGMRRKNHLTDTFLAADLLFEVQTLDLQFDQAMAAAERLHAVWEAVKGTAHERSVLDRLEANHLRELELLESSLHLYTEQKDRIVAAAGRDSYRNKMIMLQKGQLLTYNHLIIARDSRKLLDGPMFGSPNEDHAAAAAHLDSKLVILKKRQDIADELMHKWRVEQNDLRETTYDPIEMHENVAFWIYAKSRLFIDPQAPVDLSNAEARYLAFCFGEVTFAFRAIDSIPTDARIPVLSDLLDQASAIRVSFENLQLPPDPQHAQSRQEITGAIQKFENTLEQHLNRYHLAQEETSALPPHQQPIDFDFIPPQVQNQPAAAPRKMFRSKHNGVYKIRVGRSRRNDAGEELIDVLNPLNPTEVLQTFERHAGEWRRQVARQQKNLATLINQAQQLLTQSESRLDNAWRDESHKCNASSIVESLTEHANDLDDLARQIESAPNPGHRDTATLVQRLHHDSRRLLDEGEDIRVRLYKDPAYLSVDRVAYLINHGHLGASRDQPRLTLGKGNKKDFLDVYSLIDRKTGKTLWYAHFHYAEKDSPALEFMQRRGHLKTLEQNRLGTSSQRRDEQAGRRHIRIWREDIDRSTAQKIFQLAS